jgi:hypothetical protein
MDLGYKNGASIFGAALGGGGQQLGSGNGREFLYPEQNTDPDEMEETASGFVYEESDESMDYDSCRH